MRRLSSSPTRTSTPQISNFTTPKRTPMRSLAQSNLPQAMSLSHNQPSCSRVASLPSTPNANIQRTPLPLPTFRDNQPVSNQLSNSNIRNEAQTFYYKAKLSTTKNSVVNYGVLYSPIKSK